MRGLRLSVLRNAELGDCSNGGISSRCKAVTLVGPGIAEIFEPSDDAPAVRLVRRDIGNEIVLHVMPADEDGRGLPGQWMAGGAYVASSDGRFGEALRARGHSGYCAISLHDRTEG